MPKESEAALYISAGNIVLQDLSVDFPVSEFRRRMAKYGVQVRTMQASLCG